MELQVALIGIAIFLVSAVILLLISVFGIKEKSYEEALAEQRQQTNALLGHHAKPKPKENKKQKKAGKKVKEKHTQQNVEKENAEDSENNDSTSPDTSTPEHHGHNQGKLHVEFNKEPSVIVVDPTKEVKDLAPLNQQNKKRNKKEKVRPILINSNPKPTEKVVVADDDIELPPANHFEQLHPKDEFELKHSHIKEEAKSEPIKEQPKEQPVKEKSKGKHSDNKKEAKEKINKQQTVTAEVTAPVVVEDLPEPEVAPVEVVPQQSAPPAPNPKDKKKKKSDFNNLQMLAGDKQGIINLSTLLTLVRKAELSRSEVQILIDLLLNKQHEAPAVIDEWTEGKADPVQKLKKQLAEKEKALADEQEALAGAQAKLREIRAEQSTERSQLQQRIRILEETLQAKMADVQAMNARNHTFNQKLNQTQAQLNEEAMKVRQFAEENNVLKMHTNQLEAKLAQMQEMEITNLQLEKEFHDLKELHNQVTQHNQVYHNQINQKEDMINHLQKQIEDWESRMSSLHRQEGEITQLKTTCQQQLEELRHLEHSKAQLLEDNRTIQKQRDDSEMIISKLKADLQKVEEEKLQLENAKLNGSAEESKMRQVELLNLHNELSSVKMQLQQTEKKSKEMDMTVVKLKSEIEEQKTKNNELRQKNWKVMEALNAAETRNKNATNNSNNLPEEILKAQKQEQELHRKFLQRLFPDINVPSNLTQDEWFASVEKVIETHVKSHQSQQPSSPDHSKEVPKLMAEIERYKDAIDESESILTKLQEHVEQEELNWRNKLEEKETEIKKLKNNSTQQILKPESPLNSSENDTQGVQFAFQCIEKSLPAIVDEVQSQINSLQLQLEQALQAKQQLEEECRVMKNQQTSLAAVEQLSEQVHRLQEQLEIEQRKNLDFIKSQEALNNTVKTQHHNTTNGTSLSTEQMLSTSSSAASSLTEVALKPKNKKKKKKNNHNA